MVRGRGHQLDEHVPQLRELAVFFVLDFDEAPLGLSPQQLLPPHRHLAVAAYHCKWDVLLQWWKGEERGGGREGGEKIT